MLSRILAWVLLCVGLFAADSSPGFAQQSKPHPVKQVARVVTCSFVPLTAKAMGIPLCPGTDPGIEQVADTIPGTAGFPSSQVITVQGCTGCISTGSGGGGGGGASYSGVPANAYGQTGQASSYTGIAGFDYANSNTDALTVSPFGGNGSGTGYPAAYGQPGVLVVQGGLQGGAIGISGNLGGPYTGTTNGQTATAGSFMGVGGLYNTSAPTLTNTQFSPFQLDASGNLNVNVKAGGGSTTFPYSGTSSGQTATTASFLGEAGVYNSAAPTLSNTQAAPIQLDVNGNQKVNVSAALPAGSNSIGTVVLGAGSAAIGTVTFGSAQPVTQSGTWNIGTITTLPALASGSNTIGALTANQSVNVSQMNGVTTTMGAGASNTGTQRVVTSTDSTIGLQAGTNTIGVTGSISSTVCLNPTISTSAYTAGYDVGGLFTFTNAFRVASGVLESVSINVQSTQTAGWKFYLFNAATAAISDHAAPALSTTDAAKIMDVIPLTNNDSGLGANTTIYSVDGIGKQITSSGTSLYGALVTTGTPTFAATAVTVCVGVLSD